jgi:histidyl-tRNA synthetase
LRANNIAAELYPDAAKMNKQMTYADKRQIQFVVIAGETERLSGSYTLKNMKNGNQQSVNYKELESILTVS